MKPKSVSPKLYDREYYQKLNHGYSNFKKDLSLLPEFANFIKKHLKPGMKVLDVGCGRGETVILCHKLKANCIGIDYSPAAIEIARQTLKQHLPSKKNNVMVMNAKRLNFKANSFDLIIMLDVVEHLHDWELHKSLKEAKRVLKKGGKLLIHTSPNKNNMDIIRNIAKLFGITLRSQEFHVNEQNIDSLANYASTYFDNFTISSKKDRQYFYNQMDQRSDLLKIIAQIADFLYDSRLINLLMKSDSIANYLATDIYVVGTK